MGRGKNNRRRASLDGPAPTTIASNYNLNSSNAAVNSKNPLLNPISLNNAPTNPQEIRDAIEFHWKNLSLDLKHFLLKNPQELSLRKFVDFWTSSPARRENTSPQIAASICGCSWYLALNYMSIGEVVEARALILNGCFLQQCYNKPIEEIAEVSLSVTGHDFRASLPFFTDGLLAISSEERMSTFLRTKVSGDYQRRMSFATQTTQAKKKVQDYVDQIGSDWNNGREAGAEWRRRGEARRRRASLDALPAESFIEIGLVDDATGEETKMRYGISMTLKSLFKKYAEDRNLSLRQLRFSYEGRTLFLSSVGQKTPQDLGMKHLDTIRVINNAVASRKEEESSSSSSDESKENSVRSTDSGNQSGKTKKSRRPCRRASWAGPEILGEEERLKLMHSRQLSRVFAEAVPKFESIRRKLNALNLTCTPPKVKGKKKVPAAIDPLPSDNPNGEGTGGKAGTPFYAVHVGAPDNLHKTRKRSPSNDRGGAARSIDLHGLTRDQALSNLDAKLPEWIDAAMRGSHPYTIRVVIVCGGGNQVLSEAVEGWIRGNESVARAPQRKFSRRRTM